MKARLVAIIGAALLGILLGLGLLRLLGESHQFVGTLYQDQQAFDFTLVADDGQPASLHDFRGKAVLIYFGYTFCPDVCPATLSKLADSMDALGDRADEAQVLMVTVDPARDTPEVLDEYMAHFDPSFIGFTGSEQQIAEVAADYGVFFEAEEGTAATGYLVNHWAGVYVIDPDGNLVESFTYGTTGEDIAADVIEWL